MSTPAATARYAAKKEAILTAATTILNREGVNPHSPSKSLISLS